jgi:hypothetical protein
MDFGNKYTTEKETLSMDNLNGNNTSELRRMMTPQLFEKAYKIFIEQADENAQTKKSRGQRLPYGISKADNERMISIDEGGMAQHYGQGAASYTPYINWHVVSVYYLPSTGQIIVGIEKDRYPFLDKMKPLRYSQIGNKKIDVAVFYETTKDSVDYAKLYQKFIEVSEEVMRIGVYVLKA